MPHEQPHLDRDYHEENEKLLVKQKIAALNLILAANKRLRKMLECGGDCASCICECEEIKN